MQPIIGDSSLFQTRTSGSLHNINNQLFRITLLADMLSNDVQMSESKPQVSQIVDEIKTAAFDVAKSGKELMMLIQQHNETGKS